MHPDILADQRHWNAAPRVWYLNPGEARLALAADREGRRTVSEVPLVMFESYGVSDTGCVRSENQDRILVDHSSGLFMVADGMGGHRHGEIAAELAVSTLRYYVETSRESFDATWPFGFDFDLSIDANRLATGIQLANQQV